MYYTTDYNISIGNLISMFAAMGIDNKPHGQVHKGRDSLKSYVSIHAGRSNSSDLDVDKIGYLK